MDSLTLNSYHNSLGWYLETLAAHSPWHWIGSRAAMMFLIIMGVYSPAHAYQVSSGTGFFISKSGYIITNQHVVDGCDVVQIRGAVRPANAQVVKTDADIDLALLKTTAIPPKVAHLRENNGYPIREGDGLLVIGFPEEYGVRGEYKIERSRVKGLTGPLGGDRWIQFEDAARQGNSGGPLLDESGNVIGVIVGKTEKVRTNLSNGEQEIIDRSDIAISLPYLWDFLANEGIQTVTMTSALRHSDNYLTRMAKGSIVNIHCRK